MAGCAALSRPTALIYKLVTLESELSQARKLLEAPAKRSLWRQLWGMGSNVAVVTLVMMFIGVGAWGGVETYFDGNFYLKQTEAGKIGYVSGVSDAFRLVAQNPPGVMAAIAKFNNYSKPMTNIQVKAIVDNYMKSHPQHWHIAMADLVYKAVIDASELTQ